MGGGVQLMHAGEEALFVLIPLAIVMYFDHRQRRKDKQRAAAAGSPAEGADGEPSKPERTTDLGGEG
ncbi:MAG TPA: hypothetical protein VHJ78_05235 [Actinomycetota bacterium]|nr:hypothetical protein [Actinomycetota bacterium]